MILENCKEKKYHGRVRLETTSVFQLTPIMLFLKEILAVLQGRKSHAESTEYCHEDVCSILIRSN